MYYSEEILDQVRTANDIVDVIGQSVQLKRAGSNYVGLCPFHNEKTPSFSVSRPKQMYYCFGCHKGGNVITFVEEYNNMNFLEAVGFLAERAGIRLPEREITDAERQSRDERTKLLEVNRLAGTYYYCSLRSPAGRSGLEYLEKRGLSQETMKAFALGFAPKTPSDGLYRYMKSKGISDDLLRRSGLMNVDEKRGSMYDKFWNRVIFPILDTSSRIIGFGGRVMGDAKPKYLNSPETRVFDKSRNLYALHLARRTREDYLVLCEGYMDVISMHQAGFTNAVASLGTSLTPGHCSLLARYTRRVVLSYDSDKAGVAAAMRAIPMLQRAGITPKILRLDPYKDPDELIQALGHDAMRERLEKAQNALMFEIEVTKRDYDWNDPDSKTRFFENTAGRIAALETEMERQNYIDAVCREYMVDRRQLQELVTRRLVNPLPEDSRSGSTWTEQRQSFPRQTSGFASFGTAPGQTASLQGSSSPGQSASLQGSSSPGQDVALQGGSAVGYGPDSNGSQGPGWDTVPDMDYDPAALYGYDDSGFYEDGETGEMFQAPPTATRKNRSVSVREQGDDISRRLLLNYICRYPAIFATISRFVKPEDFGDGLTGQAARVIYGQMQRKGSVDEASVLSSFPEAQDQTQIAGIFHTLDQASSGKDREKAIRETLIKVFSAAPSGDGTDLNQVIARKKQEAELRKLQIIL